MDSTITNIISDTNAKTEFALTNSNVDITGGLSCNTLTTTGNATVGGSLFLGGTQINFNSDNFISNSAGSNSGNHLVIFINGIEYKIKLENAS